MSTDDRFDEYREFLKNHWWIDVFFSGKKVDQQLKVPFPPLQKEYPEDTLTVDLNPPEGLNLGKMPLIDAINERRSHRVFNEKPLTMEELSFLLWTTQGVHEIIRNGSATRRTVPSGGSRHPFETYLIVFGVEGLSTGIYRYLPLEHKLIHVKSAEELEERLVEACMKQVFIGKSAVAFAWTTVPYRTEWSYDKVSHKIIAIDAGHLCQNLYLSCVSLGIGCCAVGAYFQEKMDELLGVDGKEEFTVYMAAVGKY